MSNVTIVTKDQHGKEVRTEMTGGTPISMPVVADPVPAPAQRLEQAGVPIGSAIAWATSKLGVKACARCKAWTVILDSATTIGWDETIRQMKAHLHD